MGARSITRRGPLLVVLVVSVLLSSTPSAHPGDAGFTADVSRISAKLRERMTGKSWHRGCPVPIRNLRLIKLSYHGFDGERHTGKLVVHQDAAGDMVDVFRTIYSTRFKIRRMHLVDHYGASDQRSMRADNTSAFNCRYVSGTTRWSQHAYGRAIDVNPVENPYVGSDGSVSPRAGRCCTDRSEHVKGMIRTRGPVVDAFADVGWGWGGNWSSSKDYQHFSATGT